MPRGIWRNRVLVEQPAWMRAVKVGDVITNGGAYRIVREVSRKNDGRLHSVTLVIRHCSWTHRCYTILSATDLRTMGYRKVRVSVQLKASGIDRKIQQAIRQGGGPRSEFIVTCCDVEGLP